MPISIDYWVEAIPFPILVNHLLQGRSSRFAGAFLPPAKFNSNTNAQAKMILDLNNHF